MSAGAGRDMSTVARAPVRMGRRWSAPWAGRGVTRGRGSRAHPDTRFRVLATTTATDNSGVARLELLGPDPSAVCEQLRRYDPVTDLTILERTPEPVRVQLETNIPLLLTAIEGSGIPLETPFEIQDGRMTLEATVPQRQLSNLGEQLEAFGIPFTIEQIKQDAESEDLLTDRQCWLLQEAVDRGYYDTPRRITLTELADALDLAVSTCSEVLHRAEGSVLKRHVEQARDTHRCAPAAAD